MKRPQWYTILLAARRVVGREGLTSTALAGEAGLDTPSASAWLSKFERWGYVTKGEKVPIARRWAWSWVLTTYGQTRKAPTRSNQIRGEKPAERASRIAANPPRNQG